MRGVREHVHHVDAAAGAQRVGGAGEQGADRLRRLLVQHAEEDRDVVAAGQGGVVVAAGQHVDAVGDALSGDQILGDGDDGRQVQHGALDLRIGLRQQHGVGAGAAADVQQARAVGQVDHRHDGAADAEGASVHRHDEGARAVGVVAEVLGGALGGLTGAGQFGQRAPGGVDVAVVADGAAQIAGPAGHEERRSVGRVAVDVAVLGQQFQCDAGVQQQAGAARVKAEPLGERVAVGGAALGQRGEDAEVRRSEKDAGVVERAGHADDAGRVGSGHVGRVPSR